ncbi:hypothetical protein [Streptomyces avicenniae]|uniref:hypothetical protein n=1 Tax=Streptomyces avicenniae TaxID=500153 RepID=UPI00167D5A03|nr:hypothetical protein [Streptomyces avicenniae]
MSSGEGVVADAAVRAAWDSYRVLDDSTTPEERRRARRRIEAAVAAYGRDEVYRGAAFLVGVLTAVLAEDAEDRDPLGGLVPAVLGRLRAFDTLDVAHVPMVAGALTAAVLGQDVVAWRDRLGPIPPQEAAALGFTLWLLADLHDLAVDRPGATDALVRRAFESLEYENA